ncbi:hypothetical protein [Arsenophonus endosymbiont of Aleurodicus floccissimus]|uniref:hypothetical protein n=1 Tax=Arsenophonus endosymbiont of Aleurodicus floccissimus TaxID=2152761 RepID=UPI001EDEA711|nr:hypothetical protein [Arsenophonus endosymbiont of Aleurodicus floccissimus]
MQNLRWLRVKVDLLRNRGVLCCYDSGSKICHQRRRRCESIEFSVEADDGKKAN